jgi:hypothetical protein
MLTGPAGRRQSSRCRSVHGSHAETSIWCPPVQGARARTEHPSPHRYRLCVVCGRSRRVAGSPEPSSRKQASDSAGSQPAACHLTSAHLGLRAPPITHRLSTIPGWRHAYCRRRVMAPTAELACVFGIPRRRASPPGRPYADGQSHADRPSFGGVSRGRGGAMMGSRRRRFYPATAVTTTLSR